jgi:hypothetical protein
MADSPFGKYSATDFNVTNSMDKLASSTKERDAAIISNVEKYTQTVNEMEMLRNSVGTLLGTHPTDENGKPSPTAPKYIHDGYNAVRQNGGLAGMSMTQMQGVLQSYQLGQQEQMAQAKMRQQNSETQLNQAKAEGEILKARREEADWQRQQDVDQFSRFTDMAEPPVETVEVPTEWSGKTAKVKVGTDANGNAIFKDVSIPSERFQDKVRINGKEYDWTEAYEAATKQDDQRTLSTLLGVPPPEAARVSEEVKNVVDSFAGKTGLGSNHVAALLTKDTKNPAYSAALKLLADKNRNNSTPYGIALGSALSRVKGKDGKEDTFVADPDVIRQVLLNFNSEGDEAKTIFGAANVWSSVDKARTAKEQLVYEAKDVTIQGLQKFQRQVTDSEMVARAKYKLVADEYRKAGKNPPVTESQFVIMNLEKMPFVTRRVPQADGSVREQTFVRKGTGYEPLVGSEPVLSKFEQNKEEEATNKMAARTFFRTEKNGQRVPVQYGDLSVIGKITREPNDKFVGDLNGALARYDTFHKNMGEYIKVFDQASTFSALTLTTQNKVLSAMNTVLRMPYRTEFVGGGAFTQADADALNDIFNNPQTLSTWINKEGSIKALKKLPEFFKNEVFKLSSQAGETLSVVEAPVLSEGEKQVMRGQALREERNRQQGQ